MRMALIPKFIWQPATYKQISPVEGNSMSTKGNEYVYMDMKKSAALAMCIAADTAINVSTFQ